VGNKIFISVWIKDISYHEMSTLTDPGGIRNICTFFWGVEKGPAADATDAPQPWGLLCNPVMKMMSVLVFPSNEALVEWNWQGKTEVLGEKPVPLPLCPPHGLTRDRTWTSAVRDRRLTAWATWHGQHLYVYNQTSCLHETCCSCVRICWTRDALHTKASRRPFVFLLMYLCYICLFVLPL
jgi:hypothetical protein